MDDLYTVGASVSIAVALALLAVAGVYRAVFFGPEEPIVPLVDKAPPGCVTLCSDCLRSVERTDLQVLWAVAPLNPDTCFLCQRTGRYHVRTSRVDS